MSKMITSIIIAGIIGFILSTIEREAGWHLGLAPYFGIGIVCGLIGAIADKDN